MRSRSGRTRATPSLSGPRPLARLNPGLGGGLTPGLQSSRPESCRSGRHLSLPPEDAPASACHFPSPAPSASFPKGPAKLPTFSFTPFSSLQLLGLALCVGYECLFFSSLLLISELSGAKKKLNCAFVVSGEYTSESKLLLKRCFVTFFHYYQHLPGQPPTHAFTMRPISLPLRA